MATAQEELGNNNTRGTMLITNKCYLSFLATKERRLVTQLGLHVGTQFVSVLHLLFL